MPFAMGRDIENSGKGPLRFPELFKSDSYADLSLNQWLSSTPPERVKQHQQLDDAFMTHYCKPNARWSDEPSGP